MAPKQPGFNVIKLGGSLLKDDRCGEIHTRLAAWLRQLEAYGSPTILVIGGGDLADQVRQDQIRFGWNDVKAHWLAIAAMRNRADSFASTFGLQKWQVSSLEQLNRPAIYWSGNSLGSSVRVAILADSVLKTSELPCNWQTTSDSIALWLAFRLRSEQLVLAKRVSPLEPVLDWGKIRGLGWLDTHFDRLLSWNCDLVGTSDGGNVRMRPPFKLWIRHFTQNNRCDLERDSPAACSQSSSTNARRQTNVRIWTKIRLESKLRSF